MDGWQETLVHSALHAEDEESLFADLVIAAANLGFERCAYGIRVPLPVTNPKVSMINNYPMEWQRRYARNNYLTCDPTVAHAVRSPAMVVWTETLFASCPSFWEDARSYGLYAGLAQPCHRNNGVVGLLTLSRSHEDLSHTEVHHNSVPMYWLAQLTHEAMSRFLIPKLLPEANARLSAREVEILRWTADGKTSTEVAEILNLSKRTVDFHVNNAMVKLNTNNKTAAAIKAVILGML